MSEGETETTERLRDLCSSTETTAGWSTAPWSAVIHGSRYVGATNGQAMLMIKADAAGLTELPREQREWVESVLAPDRPASEWTSVDLSELKSWAADYPVCPVCHGEKDHYCACGDAHECGECSGDVALGWHAGTICGVALNRRLLADYIAPITGRNVELAAAADHNTLFVRGDDCRVVVMGLRREKGVANGPVFGAAAKSA